MPRVSYQEDARGRPRSRRRDYVSWLARERLSLPSDELAGGREAC